MYIDSLHRELHCRYRVFALWMTLQNQRALSFLFFSLKVLLGFYFLVKSVVGSSSQARPNSIRVQLNCHKVLALQMTLQHRRCCLFLFFQSKSIVEFGLAIKSIDIGSCFTAKLIYIGSSSIAKINAIGSGFSVKSTDIRPGFAARPSAIKSGSTARPNAFGSSWAWLPSQTQ